MRKPFAHAHHGLTSRVVSAVAALRSLRSDYHIHKRQHTDSETQRLRRELGWHLADHADGTAA